MGVVEEFTPTEGGNKRSASNDEKCYCQFPRLSAPQKNSRGLA